MQAINLLPPAALARHRLARRSRLWWRVVPLAALALAASLVWVHGLQGRVRADGSEELSILDQRLLELRRQTGERARRLAELEASIRAASAVDDLPDWSILLALLPRQGGGRAEFTSCVLSPRKVEGATVAAGRPSSYSLLLEGQVPDPKAATDLAVDLERTTLFDKVSLVDTNRVRVGEQDVIRFRIECVLSDAANAEVETAAANGGKQP